MKPLLALFLLIVTASAQEKPKLETLLMLPEPKEMRTERSVVPEGAQATVLTPAREIADVPGIEVYPKEDFAKLGLSPETFAERSKKTAEKLLTEIKPDVIKGADGKAAYAVYRGERPVMASLMIAPSLPVIFEDLFGAEIWVALPDRHSLFVFPAKKEVVEEFIADLAERYQENPHAASPEIFALKKGEAPRVVAAFAR
ncbi:hypothetical protein [Brevifollis gellanilyticus]|uniref:Uncharacterized protein n=1 Tax=Brevifollis gellanilyticus TaxID=748831 RepID=A0A512M214_9BACT|nr:hypothetical protein [Brevifollis gellanilyticus]GEP40787.1 hypothetical protein BGE01nite_00780 [Brevifollis gellanilyticus]